MELATIQRRISMIAKFKEEIKVAKEAIKQELESDTDYVTYAKAATDAATKKKQAKDQVLNQPGMRKLVDDVAANTEEINTLQEILNEELLQLYQETGEAEILGEDGQPIKFKLVAKLQGKAE